MPKTVKSRRYLPAPGSPFVTVDDSTGTIVRGPIGLTGVGDDRDPFAHQTKPRQKSKHPKLRGSEARFVRPRGASTYSGLQPIEALDFEAKAHESAIEGDFWLVADFIWPDMTAARAQPGKIDWYNQTGKHTWFPDGWIRRPGVHDLLVECKLISEVRPKDEKYPGHARRMKERVAGMRLASEILGMRFALYTELQIRCEPRFHNAKAMRRGLTSQLGKDLINEAAARLRTLPKFMTVLELSHHLGPYGGMAMNIACVLDRYGAIALDRRSYFLPEAMFRNLWPEHG